MTNDVCFSFKRELLKRVLMKNPMFCHTMTIRMISWPIQLSGNIGFWILFLIFIVYRLFVADYFPAAMNIFFPAF